MPPMEKHGAIMLVFRDDTVLLQLREDFRVWAFPGGGVEHGERWQDAAVRETFEETGLIVRFEREVGAYTRPNYSPGLVVHAAVGRLEGGEIRLDPHECVAADWFPVNALPRRLLPGTRVYLADALAGGPPVTREIDMPRWQGVLWRIGFRLRDLRNAIFRRG